MAFFNAPAGNEPLALDMASMGEGQVWVNGESIGRYGLPIKRMVPVALAITGEDTTVISVKPTAASPRKDGDYKTRGVSEILRPCTNT